MWGGISVYEGLAQYFGGPTVLSITNVDFYNNIPPAINCFAYAH
jgi:hypothetical protein